MDELDQTKTVTLTSDTDAMNNLEELLQTFTCVESTGRHIYYIAISLLTTISPAPSDSELTMTWLNPSKIPPQVKSSKGPSLGLYIKMIVEVYPTSQLHLTNPFCIKTAKIF